MVPRRDTSNGDGSGEDGVEALWPDIRFSLLADVAPTGTMLTCEEVWLQFLIFERVRRDTYVGGGGITGVSVSSEAVSSGCQAMNNQR